MNIFAFFSLFACVLCVFLGNFVYYVDKKKLLNRIFLFFCISIAYWAFSEFMYRQTDNLGTAYLWFKIGFLWPFSIALLIHFALVFTEKTKSSGKKLTYFLIYVPALFFSSVDLTTNLITAKPVKEFWGYTSSIPENPWLFWMSVIWVFGLAFLALILCVKYYLGSINKKKKQQAKYVSIAFSIPILIAFLSEVLLRVLQIKIPDLSVLSITGLGTFIGYAIWKHELFTLTPATAAENILSTMTDSLILFDPDGKIQIVNQSLLNLLGYKEDELIGKPVDILFAEERFRSKVLKKSLKNEAFKDYETKYKTKFGEEIHVSFSGSVVRSKKGQIIGIVAIVRDITERKRMEKRLLESERLVAIGEVATMVGHDLRNPLQAIENATYYLNNELPQLPIPQKTMEMLQIINNSVNYADKIVRDLHDFSATKKPTLEKTNINAIVKETLSQVEAPENVELITELSRLPQIEADKDMIKRILLNLATNGIQAMEKGGTLKVSTKKTKEFVEISFKDTGVGISKENLKNLFTPFFTTKAKGMGMGLPICKKLVESHGGSIDVESEEGKGTTFTVKLPSQPREMEVKTSGKE